MAKKEQPAESQPAAKPVDMRNDPHWGKGGSYILDPVTGLRTKAPATAKAQTKQAEVITDEGE